MTDLTLHDVLKKLPRRTQAEGFTNWRPQEKAYIQKLDVKLPGLAVHPDTEHTALECRGLVASANTRLSSIALLLKNRFLKIT